MRWVAMGEKRVVVEYAPGPRDGGGCGAVLLESIAGFGLGVFVAYGARELSWLLGGTPGVVLASAVWVAAFAGVILLALLRRVGYLIGFLTAAGMMALLVGICGWGVAIRSGHGGFP